MGKEIEMSPEPALLSPTPDGQTKDLDGCAVTMSHALDLKCPNSDKHLIIQSSMRYYCYECGIWWWRYQ